jgi:hypothetical protein
MFLFQVRGYHFVCSSKICYACTVPIALKNNVSIIGWSLFYFPFFSSCLVGGGGGGVQGQRLKKKKKKELLA